MINDSSSCAHKPPVEFTQEIRFAVVMYGGSSLCIYMNGVAQELLRLVRATAPGQDGKAYLADGCPELGGSGQVYRKLGQMLRRGDNSLQQDGEGALRTRFMIDVLSGTSAGGINAVFLAKALANDQDMSELKKLWIERADIDVLMNDNQSSSEVAAQKQPRSLLNSRQMYYMLLNALQDMDVQQQKSGRAQPTPSPYVDELDLYTTATDLVGRKIRLRLADGIARERRHLNTFHFHYSNKQPGKSHFSPGYNPFLAFAARCTSAHPVPFEPVTLSDIDEALAKLNLSARSDNPDWQAFYEDYLQRYDDPGSFSQVRSDAQAVRKRLADEFRKRPFNDGGVLDNSPFSFVIDSLQFRHSELPVDRKLLYVEPVPEHPEEELDSMERPDAFENGWLSLSVLPRYQFIREDLERLLERNHSIERVGRILKGVERDELDRLNQLRVIEVENRLRAAKGIAEKPVPQGPLTTYEFGQKDLLAMIHLMGSSWGGYQRLRVAETTDQLVTMLTRAAGLDDESDEFLAIRYLVRTWRFQNYDAYGKGKKGKVSNEGWSPTLSPEGARIKNETDKETENQFLYQYDLKWRLRRLKFVMQKIDEISCSDERSEQILEIVKYLPVTAQLTEAEVSQRIKQLLSRKKFSDELRTIKENIGKIFPALLINESSLLSRVGNPLSAAVEALNIKSQDIDEILKEATDKQREEKAEEILNRNAADFKEFERILGEKLSKPMVEASTRIKGKEPSKEEAKERGILQLPETEAVAQDATASELSDSFLARHIIRYFYDNFDRYDMISYPMLYATNIGEEVDVVEVFRVSPEDAGHLISDPRARRRKLAGTSLGNFGAFFDKEFRRNDILWGRLDGAERIITAILSSVPVPEPKQDQLKQGESLAKARARLAEERKHLKEELIKEAQRAILAEEFSAEDKASLRGLLGAALTEIKSETDNEAFSERLRRQLQSTSPELKNMQAFLDVCLADVDPLGYFRDTYKFDHDLTPKSLIRTSARASKVFGKMLEGISDKHRLGQKRVVWVTRLAQLFWGMVEVAVPDSIPNLFWHHWLKLLYFFEVVLIVLATVLLNKPMQQLGWSIFGITATINLLVLLLADKIRERHAVLRSTVSLIVTILGLFAAIGFLKVLGLFGLLMGDATPLGWLRQNLSRFSDWLAHILHIPAPLIYFSLEVLPLVTLLLIVFVLNIIGLFDPRQQPWKRWSEKMKRRPAKFKPLTIERVEQPQVSGTAETFEGQGACVFLFSLSGKPPLEWTEIFQQSWLKSRLGLQGFESPQARAEENLIHLACQREMLRDDLRDDFLYKTTEALKSAISSTNAEYETRCQKIETIVKAESAKEELEKLERERFNKALASLNSLLSGKSGATVRTDKSEGGKTGQ